MKLTAIYHSLLASLLLLSCTDSVDTPDGGDESDGDVILTIGYSTDNYGAGLSRAGVDPADGHRCWTEFNENKVETLDFYLIGQDGKVSFFKQLLNASNDCQVLHTLLEFKDNGQSNVADLTFDVLNGSSAIILVANFPLTGGDRVGKTFSELYSSKYVTLPDDDPRKLPSSIPMIGRFSLPTQISKYSNIVIPLERTIAKIRISVMNMNAQSQDEAFLSPSTFNTMLCRYSIKGRITPDDKMPNFDSQNKCNPNNIWPHFNINDILAGPYAGTEWSYPADITDVHPSDMIRENGHVYYTCPSDWVDYSRITLGCNRPNHDTNGVHKAGEDRYLINNVDDTAPIIANHEMFIMLKAPYTKKIETEVEKEVEGEDGETQTVTEIVTTYETKEYFYRVPINYRISSINDQQCFSADDLTNKMFNLYRAERNYFYDITVILDREGAASPEEVQAPKFTLKVVPYTNAGTFDYIYD